MKAVLLAAGLGTRLRPLTDTVPKCLVPIQGRPLLELWLKNLSDAGIEPFLVNTHYLADQVRRFVDRSAYRDAVTLVHETALLGTGGTLLANRSFYDDAPVLLAHADNLCLCDFRDFVRAHERRSAGTVMTMMTFVTDTPESCGIVELDERGVVVGFHEKVADPPGNVANGAVYIVESAVVDFMATLGSLSIDFSTQVVPHFVGRIQSWRNPAVHRDIGTLASLQAAQSSAKEIDESVSNR
jgi:mannose-1-phosphate guanylyltransferase